MRRIVAVLALLFVCSCSYPTTTMKATSKDALLTFTNAPSRAILYIDDTEIGPVAKYRGKDALAVPPGRHKISVVANGATIYTERAYLAESAVKNVELGDR